MSHCLSIAYIRKDYQTISYSEIVNPNILLRKLKQREILLLFKQSNFFFTIHITKKQRQRNWSKVFHITLISFHNFLPYFLVLAGFACVEIFIVELHHYLNYWELRVSTRLSHHLNLVFESVPASQTCSHVFSHFVFHRTFPHSNFVILLLFFINLHMRWKTRLNNYMRLDGWVSWAGLLFKNEPVRFPIT